MKEPKDNHNVVIAIHSFSKVLESDAIKPLKGGIQDNKALKIARLILKGGQINVP